MSPVPSSGHFYLSLLRRPAAIFSFSTTREGKDVVSGLDSLISSEPASYWPAPSSFLFVIGGDVMYIYPATDVWLNGGKGEGGSYSISCCHGY